MKKIKHIIKEFLPTFFITVSLLLLVDFFVGTHLLSFTHQNDLEKKYRVSNFVYHHSLIPGYEGMGLWGKIEYKICTDIYGFKTRCGQNIQESKDFDIAFIGDSFTEGIGLPFEDTFVGKIANAMPHTKIANLGVSSYSPSIYLAKVNELLNDGFKFKELVVYIDIGDMQDEALSYVYQDGNAYLMMAKVDEQTSVGRWLELKRYAKHFFPLMYRALHYIMLLFYPLEAKISESGITYTHRDWDRSSWTYNSESPGYGLIGVDGAVKKSVRIMTQLSDLTVKHGIKLSVGVYPWPGQLLYDGRDSRQVEVWREFCEKRCTHFYNSFPSFFEKVNKYGAPGAIDRYFIKGDPHHNSSGTDIVSTDFLTEYRKVTP